MFPCPVWSDLSVLVDGRGQGSNPATIGRAAGMAWCPIERLRVYGKPSGQGVSSHRGSVVAGRKGQQHGQGCQRRAKKSSECGTRYTYTRDKADVENIDEMMCACPVVVWLHRNVRRKHGPCPSLVGVARAHVETTMFRTLMGVHLDVSQSEVVVGSSRPLPLFLPYIALAPSLLAP
jgi:hypothetical protein